MEGDFSQRMGFRPAAATIQTDSISRDLRIALWNAAYTHIWKRYVPAYRLSNATRGSNMEDFAEAIFGGFMKSPLDELPDRFQSLVDILNSLFKSGQWHVIYSFVEFAIAHVPNFNDIYTDITTSKEDYTKACNVALLTENSAYRIVSGLVTRITDPEEIAEIDQALTTSGQYVGVKTHLETALTLLTDRGNPDYRNSIKESISAVESLAKQITGNPHATLGGALSELEKHHKLHPALKSAFSSLYGWTSNGDGIRHALMEVSDLTHEDARWMLISCSAFINFAIDSTKE